MNAVYFLQNAWSPVYAGGRWPRGSWLRALARSRSGQRLRSLIRDWNECENTTPEVGATPDSVMPPVTTHIQAVLDSRKPDVVIALGKQAEAALKALWHGPMIALPHPACRVVSTACYTEAKNRLVDGFAERLAIRQLRYGVSVVPI